MITDIEDAATWARKAFAVGGAAPRVGIYGGSYGGYSALVGMTMFAGAYDAGVSIVGIANLVTFLENTAPYRRILRITEYGDPVKDREALVKLSPITYVDRVKAPLLVQQGASDPRVPVGEAVQIHDALPGPRRAGGAGHLRRRGARGAEAGEPGAHAGEDARVLPEAPGGGADGGRGPRARGAGGREVNRSIQRRP